MDNVQVLDIGTSGCRGSLIHRGTLGPVARESLTAVYAEDRATLDVDAATAAALRVISKTGTDSGPVTVVPSTILHTLLLIDQHNRTLAPMSIWADRRAAALCAQLAPAYKDMELYARTGCPLSPAYPLYRILWHKENEPELWKQTARVASLKSFLMHMLTGTWTEDWSVAAGSGLLNVESRTWDHAALDLAGLRPESLPAVVPPEHKMPAQTDVLPGDGGPLWVCAGSGDGLLAHLGSAGRDRKTASLTLGTSGAVRVTWPVPVKDPAELVWSYPLDAGTYVCGRATNNAGNVVEAMLGPVSPDKWRELDIALMSTQVSAPLFSPFMFRERTPSYIKDARPYFFGGDPKNELERMAGVIQGVVFHTAALAEALFHLTGQPEAVALSGGLTQLRFVQRLLQCTLAIPLVRSDEEAVLLGGARLLGIEAGSPPAPLRESDAVPEALRSRTRETYERWKTACLI